MASNAGAGRAAALASVGDEDTGRPRPPRFADAGLEPAPPELEPLPFDAGLPPHDAGAPLPPLPPLPLAWGAGQR